MEKKVYLSVVIPAYNEKQSIKKGTLKAVYDYLKKQKYTWEVIVVDDGSTDNTVELAKKFIRGKKNISVMAEPHRGKGGTVIAGMLEAHGEIILFADMDQATPLPEIEKLLPKFREGFDGAIGSRSGREGAPVIRKLMAFGFSVLRALILGLPYKDTQCGFKAFKNKPAKKIFSKMEVFREQHEIKGAAVTAGFDLEILYIAKKLGYKIAEVLVDWDYGERKKVNPIKDSWEGLRDMIRIRINALSGKYDL
jgi:dolichyl-phosphate beta-glucosyltransferase